MIINDPLLGKDWRIVRDEHNWIVQKYSYKSNTTGKVVWTSKGYFTSLERALKYYCEQKIIDQEVKMTIAEYARRLKSLNEQLLQNISSMVNDSENEQGEMHFMTSFN